MNVAYDVVRFIVGSVGANCDIESQVDDLYVALDDL